MRRITVIISVMLSIFGIANAQDMHFSQYSATQPYINPALTGFFDGEYRVMLNARTQSKFADADYQTYGGSVDFSLFKNKLEDDYFGVGAIFYNDNSGSLNAVTNQMQVNLAYSLGLGYKVKHFLSVGFYGGATQKSTNWAAALFPTADREADLLGGSTKINMDMGFGLNYQFYLNNRFNAFIGYSNAHFHQPLDNAINNSTTKIFMKHSIHGAAKIRAGELVNIIPTFLFQLQNSHTELNGGLNGQFLLDNYEENKTSFTAGIYSRFSNSTINSLIFLGKMEFKGFNFGVSYDLVLNEASSASGLGYSAFEISIGYIGSAAFIPSSRLKCPDMKSF